MKSLQASAGLALLALFFDTAAAMGDWELVWSKDFSPDTVPFYVPTLDVADRASLGLLRYIRYRDSSLIRVNEDGTEQGVSWTPIPMDSTSAVAVDSMILSKNRRILITFPDYGDWNDGWEVPIPTAKVFSTLDGSEMAAFENVYDKGFLSDSGSTFISYPGPRARFRAGDETSPRSAFKFYSGDGTYLSTVELEGVSFARSGLSPDGELLVAYRITEAGNQLSAYSSSGGLAWNYSLPAGESVATSPLFPVVVKSQGAGTMFVSRSTSGPRKLMQLDGAGSLKSATPKSPFLMKFLKTELLATEHETVYKLNASSGAVLYKHSPESALMAIGHADASDDGTAIALGVSVRNDLSPYDPAQHPMPRYVTVLDLTSGSRVFVQGVPGDDGHPDTEPPRDAPEVFLSDDGEVLLVQTTKHLYIYRDAVGGN